MFGHSGGPQGFGGPGGFDGGGFEDIFGDIFEGFFWWWKRTVTCRIRYRPTI